MLPCYQGGALCRAIGNKLKKKQSSHNSQTNEGLEVWELGGAHLYEGYLKALTWEQQVPIIKNKISLSLAIGLFKAFIGKNLIKQEV